MDSASKRHLLFRCFWRIVALILVSCFVVPSYGARISRVIKNKVEIKGRSGEFNIGDYAVVYKGKKKKAIILIGKVKRNKYYGIVKKGKVKKGYKVKNTSEKKKKRRSKYSKYKKKKKKQRRSRRRRARSSKSSEVGPFGLGLIVGYGMDTMNVTIVEESGSQEEAITQTGAGTNVKVLLEYNLKPNFGLRAHVGMVSFKVAAESQLPLCGAGDTDCYTDISYTSFDIWGRYSFVATDSFKAWVGAGIGYLMPSSSDTSSLDSSSIESSVIYGGGGGADLYIAPDMYIPATVEYMLFPSAEKVSATMLNLNIGFAIRF
jgi:hypothetical protein